MRLLLDTHVWLWWMLGSSKIGKKAQRIMFDPESTLYLSTASAWEIAIKYSIGKLELPAPPASYIAARAAGGDFRVIDVRLEHALAVADLPRHHDDPFDRLLVAQSIVEGFRLITADRRLEMYDVDLVTV
ncbi:MAG: type II toxin-antitoxin system VapC family toxin [Candidatus Eremiobacteraeota bacterium]|nr:type II toxin-antitoxin system VapC family toxin [Candidatus Eremiobacteraeota bacterium]